MKVPQLKLQQEITRSSCPKIMSLLNACYYYFDKVLIIEEKNNYSLVVSSQSRVYVDQPYESIRGAKIAFSRMYRGKTWDDRVNPRWSEPYVAEAWWLEDRKRGG